MTEEHFAEIEAYIRQEIIGPDRDEEYLRELVAEVRRLQDENVKAYAEGVAAGVKWERENTYEGVKPSSFISEMMAAQQRLPPEIDEAISDEFENLI